MIIKTLIFLFLFTSVSLFADTVSVAEDSVIIEKPEYVEDDESQIGNIQREELLNVKSSDFLDVNHERKIAPYYSLIIPGAGHYKLGKKSAAKTFMAADGVLWAGFAFSMFYKARMTENLRAYLYTFGRCDGVRSDVAGKTAWNLTEHELELPLYNDSSSQYIIRAYKPSRSSDMVKADFYWSWVSEDAHQEYYDMWKERNTAKVVALYFVGAAVLNRVGSFIHARWVSKNSDTIEDSGKHTLLWSPYITDHYAGLQVNTRF